MEKEKVLTLQLKAATLRKELFDMIVEAGGSHVGCALSLMEILVALYYADVLQVSPSRPAWEDRDRLILSKGHGCAALYVILADLGFFPKDELTRFCQPGGILGGHPDMLQVPGVEASTGSLGHGLSIAVGMALAAKMNGRSYRVFCVVGDGECNEGSIWEAAMSASHHHLDNLTVIIDRNRFQVSGPTKEVVTLEPLAEKWSSFGWRAREADGHDVSQLVEMLKSVPFEKERPSAIVAETVKGKGISFMENERRWHSMLPTEEEHSQAERELESTILRIQNELN